jgi:hypothetical protein
MTASIWALRRSKRSESSLAPGLSDVRDTCTLDFLLDEGADHG